MSTTFLMLPPTLSSTSWRQEKKKRKRAGEKTSEELPCLSPPSLFLSLAFFHSSPTTESLEQSTQILL